MGCRRRNEGKLGDGKGLMGHPEDFDKDVVCKAAAFHNASLGDFGFPPPLTQAVILNNPSAYRNVALSASTNLFFKLSDPIGQREFNEYPVLEHLFLMGEVNLNGECARDRLRDQCGETLFLKVENYNTPVLSFLEKIDAQKTHYHNRKFLCRNINKLCRNVKVPDGLVIRPFPLQVDVFHYAEFYNEGLGHLGSTIDAEFVRNILKRSTFHPEGYLIAEFDGRYVGCVSIEEICQGNGGNRFGYIFQIGVVDEWKGKGLALALLQRAARFAIDHGIDRIGVGVRQSNIRALRFFTNHGFKESYQVRGYVLKTWEKCQTLSESANRVQPNLR